MTRGNLLFSSFFLPLFSYRNYIWQRTKFELRRTGLTRVDEKWKTNDRNWSSGSQETWRGKEGSCSEGKNPLLQINLTNGTVVKRDFNQQHKPNSSSFLSLHTWSPEWFIPRHSIARFSFPPLLTPLNRSLSSHKFMARRGGRLERV